MKLSKNDVVLFSGDSITDGNRGRCMDCNHIMGHGYQYIVASQLALENAENMPKFINKGYSGENAEGLLEKWQEDVIENKPTKAINTTNFLIYTSLIIINLLISLLILFLRYIFLI